MIQKMDPEYTVDHDRESMCLEIGVDVGRYDSGEPVYEDEIDIGVILFRGIHSHYIRSARVEGYESSPDGSNRVLLTIGALSVEKNFMESLPCLHDRARRMRRLIAHLKGKIAGYRRRRKHLNSPLLD